VINEFILHLKQDHEEERLRMEEAISVLLSKQANLDDGKF